jgi:hypothetical protein
VDARIVMGLGLLKGNKRFQVSAVGEEKLPELDLQLSGIGRNRRDDGREECQRRSKHSESKPASKELRRGRAGVR